jgi:hypothetical protein
MIDGVIIVALDVEDKQVRKGKLHRFIFCTLHKGPTFVG